MKVGDKVLWVDEKLREHPGKVVALSHSSPEALVEMAPPLFGQARPRLWLRFDELERV